MTESIVGRPLRRAGLLAALLCGLCSIPAARAAALPILGGVLRGPVAGPHVDLPCANPANHGSAGRILAAVSPRAGGPLRCFVQAIGHGRSLGPQIMSGPTGLGPKQIQSAYQLAERLSGGKTVAIVDAFYDPRAEADLANFRRAYGLSACTTATAVSRRSTKAAPRARCRPVTVAGRRRSVSTSTLSPRPARTVTSCWRRPSRRTRRIWSRQRTAPHDWAPLRFPTGCGGSEDSTILAADSHFNQPGVAITASSGDSGYGVSWHASLR